LKDKNINDLKNIYNKGKSILTDEDIEVYSVFDFINENEYCGKATGFELEYFNFVKKLSKR